MVTKSPILISRSPLLLPEYRTFYGIYETTVNLIFCYGLFFFTERHVEIALRINLRSTSQLLKGKVFFLSIPCCSISG
jgi:hypothetical protein